MYLYTTYEGQQAQEFARQSLLAGGEWPEVEQRVHAMEVWASTIEDPGPDHYVLVAFDADGKEIGRKKVQGY